MQANNGDSISVGRVRVWVKQAYAEKSGLLEQNMNEDTQIPVELVRPILDRVGYFMDRRIPVCAKPHRGYKISTLVGYIHGEQTNFPPSNPSAQ